MPALSLIAPIVVAYWLSNSDGKNPFGPMLGAFFFSWLGGVLSNKRRQGIGRALLLRQHELCLERGYQSVETEAFGSNRPMLILNLREGFEIIGVRLGAGDVLTVQMRKTLAA